MLFQRPARKCLQQLTAIAGGRAKVIGPEHRLMIYATALAGKIIWLGFNGLLWYTRPSDLLSLLGSSIFGRYFFRGGVIGGYA